MKAVVVSNKERNPKQWQIFNDKEYKHHNTHKSNWIIFIINYFFDNVSPTFLEANSLVASSYDKVWGIFSIER